MLTKLEHLLVILNEEAVESAQECDKALRFGLDTVSYKTHDTPRRRLAREINEFFTVLEMVRDELPDLINYQINYSNALEPITSGEIDMDQKKKRLEAMFKHAIEEGHLEPDEQPEAEGIGNRKPV